MLTLKELIDKCLSKDKTAWQEFVVRFKTLVENSVRHRLCRHNFPYTLEDIKDITQAVFLDIWEFNKLSMIREDDKIQGWIAIVAQNSAVDFIRSSKRFLRQEPITDENNEILERNAVSYNDPFKELANNEIGDVIGRIMDSLPVRDRLVMKLRLLHDLSHSEIAKMTGMPINTVSIVIWRSLAKMKSVLKKKGFGRPQ